MGSCWREENDGSIMLLSQQLPLGDARVEGHAVAATPEGVDVFVAGHRMPIEDP